MIQFRVRLLRLVCCAALLIVWGRVAYLQLALGPWRRIVLSEAEVRVRSIPAPRGSIVALDGTVLARDRCDADLSVHFRYLERPLNDAWLTAQARARLSNRERRNPVQVEQAKEQLYSEVQAMWQSLAELTGAELVDLDRRARRVQQRVARIADSVNRRRRERSGGQAPDDVAHSTPAPLGSSEPPTSEFRSNGFSWRRMLEWLTEQPQPPVAAEPWHVTVLEQNRYYKLVENISPETVLEFAAHPERFPGVRLEQRIRRMYPTSDLACAVVGYVEPTPDADDSEPGAPQALSSGVGRSGVEGFYDSFLCGEPGEIRDEVTAQAGVSRVLGARPPRPGRDVTLTLDLQVQRFAEELLERPVQPEPSQRHAPAAEEPADRGGGNPSGAIVVLDVRSGAVLAAATAPRFDLNVAARPGSPEAQALSCRPDSPLFSRVVQMTLPPGSTFKPVVALGAIKHGIDPRETFFCRGYLHEPDKFRCLIYRHHGVGHEVVTMSDAIVRSCNVYFFHLAEVMGGHEVAGWGTRFGFGERTGLDLAGEDSGSMPTWASPATDRRRSGSEGEQFSLAIGQGTILATPVQVAVMMAAISNGGLRVVPHVRRDAVQPPRPIDGIDPDSDAALAVVRHALERVVADPRGTGHEHVYLPEIDIAGKTGTAQSGSSLGDHAWFVGYFPAKKPEFAIVVVLTHAGSGAHAAGSRARELVKRMIELGYFAQG
jgi:penicillin-binding protein 2